MRFPVVKILLLVLSLAGCRDKGKVSTEDALVNGAKPTAEDFEAIYMLPESAGLSAGRTVNFEILGLLPYDNSTILNDEGMWSVSNTDIIELTEGPAGRIRALKPGEADISFQFGSVTKTAHVIVANKTLDQIKISEDSLVLDTENVNGVVVPMAASLVLNGLYSDGTVEDLSTDGIWSCRDTKVLACDGQGKFRALTVGSTEITVKILNLEKTIPVTVTTHDPIFLGMQISPSPLVIEKNTPRAFVVAAAYSNGQTLDITASTSLSWSAPNLVTLAGTTNKTISGVAIGSGTLTVNWGAEQTTVPYKVIDPLISVLAIESPVKNFAFAKGETERFFAKLTYNDGTVEDVSSLVTFEVSDLTLITPEAGATYGTYRSLKNGAGTLTARLGSMHTTSAINISLARLIAVELTSADSGTLGLNLTRTFVAKGRYTDNSLTTVTTTAAWSVEAMGGTGSMQANGIVHGTGQGLIRLKATLQGIVGYVDITVGPAIPLSIELAPVPGSGSTLSVSRAAGNQPLTAMVTYSDGVVADRTSTAEWTYVIVGENFSFAGYVRNDLGFRGVVVPLANGFFRAEARLGNVVGSRVIGVIP